MNIVSVIVGLACVIIPVLIALWLLFGIGILAAFKVFIGFFASVGLLYIFCIGIGLLYKELKNK